MPAFVKKTVSLPAEMYDAAIERAKKMGYESFSAYLQYLVAKDLKERPAHLRTEETPPRAN